jgi:cob(I)alamin adenosyltransferase
VARLYTRTGDAGTTGLLGSKRVPKDDPRIEAIGAVDELNAALGVTLAAQKETRIREALLKVQDDLFTVGAELAVPWQRKAGGLPRVSADHVSRLEAAIVELDIGRVREFILPRGSEALARLHWARTVARRAERRIVALSRHEAVNPETLRYLNRLSSLLYQMAVWVQKRERRRPEHPTYRP